MALTEPERERPKVWELSSRKGRSPGSLIGGGEPNRQLSWRFEDIMVTDCVFLFSGKEW